MTPFSYTQIHRSQFELHGYDNRSLEKIPGLFYLFPYYVFINTSLLGLSVPPYVGSRDMNGRVVSWVLVPLLGFGAVWSGGIKGAIAQESISEKKSGSNVPDLKIQYIGAAEPKIEMLRAADLGAQQVQTAFQDAQWKFYPDGRFAFVPTQPQTPVEQRLFIIGTYKRIGDRLEIQGEQLQRNGAASMSIDGTVQKGEKGVVLDVSYIFSSVNFQQIAKISQELLPDAQSTNLFDLQKILSASKLELGTAQQAQELIDKTRRKIEGIEIGIYDIFLEGETEAQPFDKIPGQIFIVGGGGMTSQDAQDLGMPIENLPPEIFQDLGTISSVSILSSGTFKNGYLSLSSEPSEKPEESLKKQLI